MYSPKDPFPGPLGMLEYDLQVLMLLGQPWRRWCAPRLVLWSGCGDSERIENNRVEGVVFSWFVSSVCRFWKMTTTYVQLFSEKKSLMIIVLCGKKKFIHGLIRSNDFTRCMRHLVVGCPWCACFCVYPPCGKREAAKENACEASAAAVGAALTRLSPPGTCKEQKNSNEKQRKKLPK